LKIGRSHVLGTALGGAPFHEQAVGHASKHAEKFEGVCSYAFTHRANEDDSHYTRAATAIPPSVPGSILDDAITRFPLR